MRNPYKTGGWVSGREHYGRHALLAHILESDNDAVLVIGNRRMGKTSLLRQLEYLTADGATYVPLFWDLQGSETMEDMTNELLYSVEDEKRRFTSIGVELHKLYRDQADAPLVLRLLRAMLREADKRLLLLVDEAEALLNLAETDPRSLARLRRVLLSAGGLRVVLTGTKVVSRLNLLTRDWPTSPFLFGFSLRNLTGLDDESAAALIRQTQDPVPVQVSDEQVRQIMEATGNHPYLLQVLCSRLFLESGELKPLQPEDLYLDSTLADYFDNDYRWLSPGERQVLLSIVAGHRDVAAISQDTGLPPAAVQDFVYSQERLGKLRITPQGLAPANEFLRRWLEQNYEQLLEQAHASDVPDDATQQMINAGREEERRYVTEMLRIQRTNLRELELQRAAYGVRVPVDLINDINRTKAEIERLEERLDFITSGAQTDA
ncbi:MAG: ATP-binding protein [Caldilineales bacterium]|nr:ATP-binding protein [Caldilineales bacterium]MDW8316660.1 AAA family ATPase [Anaerolineae bacterium]